MGSNYTQHGKVLLFITDATAYMIKAGKNLRHFYPNMTHLTCLAHGLNRVADKVRTLYSLVNTVIASVKGILNKALNRIQRFKEM